MPLQKTDNLEGRDGELIDILKNDPDTGINYIYAQYKTEFIRWTTSRFKADEEEAEEIFQASILALIENLRSGKLTEMTSSVKTYLFSIGKNKSLDYIKKKQRHTEFSFERFALYDDSDEKLLEEKEFQSKLNLVMDILKDLGPPCYTLLSLFYFEKKSWGNIAEEMGYKDDHSAKNMKYKCMQKIQKLIQKGQSSKKL